MVQNCAVTKTLLRGSADFSLRACDVVEWLVLSLDPDRVKCLQNPIVEESVAVCKRHPLNKFSRCVKGIGDGVSRFDEHGSAATDSSVHTNVSSRGLLRVNLVSKGLE